MDQTSPRATIATEPSRPSSVAQPSLVDSVPAAEWILRACLAVRCLALGDAYLWNRWERDSSLFEMMLFHWHWPERTAMLTENVTMALMVVAGILVLIAPWLQRRRWWRTQTGPRVEQASLWFVLAFEILFALALTIRGGRFGSELTFGAHALRIAIPLTLLFLSHRRTRPAEDRFSGPMLTILRWSIAITFIVHGWEAWQLAPEYTTLILGGWQNTSGSVMHQTTAESILQWIGGLDIVLGLLIALTRWKSVLVYVIVWGLLSALGRTIGGGLLHYPETFLRIAHAGGPLALLLEWNRRSRHPP